MGRRSPHRDVQRIALLLPIDLESGRAVLRGVKAFAGAQSPWAFHVALPTPQIRRALAAWQPAGVIAHIDQKLLIPPLRKLRAPVVNVCNALTFTPFPRVGLDNTAVGMRAAEHLLERGLKYFAFVGHCRHLYVRDRRDAFEKAVTAAGAPPIAVFDSPWATPWGSNWALAENRLHRWLLDLPKPVGVLTANDPLGLQLSEVCRMIQLNVPDEVSIVGVDNDELVCQLATPPLSSVSGGGEQLGYAAAALLDRCLRGEAPPRSPVEIPPAGVVTRQSSDPLFIQDADVRAVMRFIAEHATEPLAVTDLLGELQISRRSLERKFRLLRGRTLLEEIHRVRIEKTQRMLSETDLTIAEIATRSGFASPERLTLVFRSVAGITPSQYRARFASASSGQGAAPLPMPRP